MNITSTRVIRWAGVPAILAGLLYMATQFVHPSHEPASISSSWWALAHYMTIGFGVFGLLGISGIYARQVKETGWLGLIGFLMFFGALILVSIFGFFEAVVVPELLTEAPNYVDDVYSIFDGGSGPGALGAIYNLNGLLYLVGGVLFGIVIYRANVLPRRAAIVFILGTVFSLAAAISEGAGRASTFVLAAGLVWMGYALLTEESAA